MMDKKISVCIHYLVYLKDRIVRDRLAVNAGYMAYISLLSLVPLVTVLVTTLSQFPVFHGITEQIQEFVFLNFMPAAGDAVKNALNIFVSNTSSMTAIGGAFVFITAMMLVSTIDKNLNFIWRVKRKRRLVYSFSMYWMVLTLGPLLMGASLALSSYITSEQYISLEVVSGIYRILPMILSMSTFVVLYMLVPNIKVKFFHACTGALVAGLLFEFSKKGFAMYITAFPSYQLIYGALAAIPILFVWVYLCWFIVLVGAEVTASLGEREDWYDEEPYYPLQKLKEKFSRKRNDL
ncbi:MAG TPA: virulence factor BrkB family protein [Vibrio sp.]|uniref:virulence factor BrkB family protein n=1 Tax=Vibrio sp. TaxID=678 RepID=UPI000EBDEC3B|nr:virulence factor BrkB family protein [Vibrio sp.]HCH02238.1 virulence factor BrkB family protein [Vibrio sp.]